MPTLLHLNGPTCVGKSTIAAAIAAQRPGAICIDIDAIRTSQEGWQTDPASKREARTLGLALAGEHLRDGHDVVLPQLIVRGDEIDRVAAVAVESGAVMVELVLLASPDELVVRLDRERGGAHPRDEFGVDELRAQMEFALDAFPALVAVRDYARLLDVSEMSFVEALAAVRNVLENF